jgi:hypothetical protein
MLEPIDLPPEALVDYELLLQGEMLTVIDRPRPLRVKVALVNPYQLSKGLRVIPLHRTYNVRPGQRSQVILGIARDQSNRFYCAIVCFSICFEGCCFFLVCLTNINKLTDRSLCQSFLRHRLKLPDDDQWKSKEVIIAIVLVVIIARP